MVRVTGIDHLVVSVGDFEKSKAFYAPLMEFLGFGVEAEYSGSMMGWANGKTLFWIAAADAEGKKHKYRKGDIGFHHYAFRLRNRKDVDALEAYLEEAGATIVDPAGEYYDDYYAVFFLDPDGMKLEGMRYGEKHEQAARKRAAKRRAAAAKRYPPASRGIPAVQSVAESSLPSMEGSKIGPKIGKAGPPRKGTVTMRCWKSYPEPASWALRKRARSDSTPNEIRV